MLKDQCEGKNLKGRKLKIENKLDLKQFCLFLTYYFSFFGLTYHMIHRPLHCKLNYKLTIRAHLYIRLQI